MNTQYRKNLKAVLEASKSYCDESISNLKWELGTYDLGVDTDNSVARVKTLHANTIKSMVDYIGGKTVKYNQFLINNELTVTRNGVTFTNNNNGTWTVNGTSTARANTAVNIPTYKIPAKLNDKIFIIGCPSGGSVSTYYLAPVFYNDGSYVTFDINNTDVGSGKIVTVTNSNVNEVRIEIIGAQSENQTVNNLLFKPELINLTSIFGAGNEPSDVATAITLLKANGYKLDGTDEYSTGKLKQAITTSVNFLPINVWDEEWEVGAYYTSTGDKNNFTSDYIRNKNTINVYPNTTYYFKKSTVGLYVLCYDINGNYLGNVQNVNWKYFNSNDTFTTPNNCYKINIMSNQTTYKNDICINISNASYNGNYYPYVAPITKPIPSEVLADSRYGLGFDNTNYNHLDIDGHLRGSWGIVDLGTLTWQYNSANNVFYASISDKVVRYLTTTFNIICSKYETGNGTDLPDMVDKTIIETYLGSNKDVAIKDTSYNGDVATFKTAMSGVYLVYELATAFDQDYSQYFTPNWNKVDLDKQYATCEMVVAEPIDMPNSISNLFEEVKA